METPFYSRDQVENQKMSVAVIGAGAAGLLVRFR